MNKPIIAMSFSGIIMKDVPWKKAHEVWFEHYAKKLNKPEIAEYAKKENWFNYVDEVMLLAQPKFDDILRTTLAREKYFEIVCNLGCIDPALENKEVVKYLYSIKENFLLGLITTTPQKTIDKILSALGHEDLFDFVECSNLEEKDDKLIVFNRFMKKFGKPKAYFGGERKEIVDFCRENNIEFIITNFNDEKELKKVILELKNLINNL